MDIRARVEARKVELAAGEAAAKSAEREAQRARAEAERERREAAIDQIAQDISRGGVEVQHRGERLELVPNLEPLDVDALGKTKLKDLLDREARKLWSQGDNWLVISLIVAGVFCLPFYLVGAVMIVAGFWRGSHLNTRYRAIVRAKYPTVFGSIGTAPTGGGDTEPLKDREPANATNTAKLA